MSAIPLKELNASFIRYGDERTINYVDTLAEASGVMFMCPQCKSKDGHMVVCWFRERGVPDDATPGPGRWAVTGEDITDLTLAPSVHLSGEGCGWHGFVTNGAATLS
jgi:hypothetical protein